MSDDVLEDFRLPRGMAAVLTAELWQAWRRIEDAGLEELPDREPLPEGILTCGEVLRFLPALTILLRQAYKDLWEPDALAKALREANLDFASSEYSALN